MTTKLLVFAIFVFVMILMSLNYKKKRKRILFFGDSITEQGALFGGYIQRITRYLQEDGIEDKYELVGLGKGGNKVTDLLNRISKDVLSRGGDILVLFIGINDVWHKYSHDSGTDEATFKSGYQELIDKLKLAEIKVIVCTPTVIGENVNEDSEVNKELSLYSNIIKEIAAKDDLYLVDLRATFTEYLQANNPENVQQGILTTDGVHLNERGNQLVAEQIWMVLKDL